VVVRVARGILAARLAHQLERPVRDDLVGVHVGRRARAALHHVDHEVPMPVAVDDLLASAIDGARYRRREKTEPGVGARRRLLHHRQGTDQHREVGQVHARDPEVLDRTQRLNAVESIRWHLAIAEQIVLHPRHTRSIGLFAADLRRARVLEPPAHDERDPAEHVESGRPVGGQAGAHCLAIDLDREHGREGTSRGAVGGGVQQRAFPGGVTGAEQCELGGTLAAIAQDLDLAGRDHEGAGPGLALTEQEFPRTQISLTACGHQPIQKRVVQSGKELAASKRFAHRVHVGVPCGAPSGCKEDGCAQVVPGSDGRGNLVPVLGGFRLRAGASQARRRSDIRLR